MVKKGPNQPQLGFKSATTWVRMSQGPNKLAPDLMQCAIASIITELSGKFNNFNVLILSYRFLKKVSKNIKI